MASRPIVVVGSSNTDMIIRLDHLPRPGETVLGGEFATAAGGKGANQAVGAARAGGTVRLVARLGADDLGRSARAGFERDGIDIRHLVEDAASPSGVALIFVARDGENCIAVASGANARLSPADVDRAAPAFEGAAVLLTQLETPLETVEAAIALAERQGVPAILNPAPARPLPDSLLRRLAILSPNETEAEILTGLPVRDEDSAAQAADRLHARGVRTVIITLGARGAWLSSPEGRQRIPGFSVRAVDTTAAGDIFHGALAVALAEPAPLPGAIRFAHAAAAISVTRPGAQPSAPTRAEIDQFLAHHSHA